MTEHTVTDTQDIKQEKIMPRTSTLEKLKYSVQSTVTKKALDSVMGREFIVNQIKNDLCIRLTREIWSQKLGETDISYPKNWIEALKERWLPIKWRRRWPVVYTVRKFKMSAIYPDYHPPGEFGKYNFSIQEMPSATKKYCD